MSKSAGIAQQSIDLTQLDHALFVFFRRVVTFIEVLELVAAAVETLKHDGLLTKTGLR